MRDVDSKGVAISFNTFNLKNQEFVKINVANFESDLKIKKINLCICVIRVREKIEDLDTINKLDFLFQNYNIREKINGYRINSLSKSDNLKKLNKFNSIIFIQALLNFINFKMKFDFSYVINHTLIDKK